MSLASLDAFLAPISGPDPCGTNLENDPTFVEFEQATQGKPERQIGKTIQPAEDPDWKLVTKHATDLLARTKDLRVCVQLSRALLHTDGLAGLAQGLALVAGLVQGYWEPVHPRLDPEDGNDPTMRLNVLATLTAPDMMSAVRATPLVSSRRVGRFSYKDIEVLQAKENGAPNATLEAAIMDCELPQLQADAAAAAAALEAVKRLEAVVAERVGAGGLRDIDRLRFLIQKIAAFMQATWEKRAPAPEVAAAAPEGAAAAEEVPVKPALPPGEIGSREDVLQALDRISKYYAKHEPSSPIPMFIDRCKRLVTMSFLDIVKELAPDAVKQVEVLKGKTE